MSRQEPVYLRRDGVEVGGDEARRLLEQDRDSFADLAAVDGVPEYGTGPEANGVETESEEPWFLVAELPEQFWMQVYVMFCAFFDPGVSSSVFD